MRRPELCVILEIAKKNRREKEEYTAIMKETNKKISIDDYGLRRVGKWENIPSETLRVGPFQSTVL